MPFLLLPAILAVLLLAAPAYSQMTAAECDPAIQRAIEDGATRGVEADIAVVRHPEQGVREPDSIFDISCITDMFNFQPHDHFFSAGQGMGSLLGLLEREVCNLVNQVYRGNVGRQVSGSPWATALAVLPGLVTAAPQQPAAYPDSTGHPDPMPQLPRIQPEDEPSAPTHQLPPSPNSRTDRFRSIIGGGR